MYFRQTNSDLSEKNRNLDKQTTPSEAIKHQCDKQIIFVYRIGVQCFNPDKGC